MKSSQYKIDLKVGSKNYKIFDIRKAAKDVGFDLEQLPFTLRILFENIVRLEPSIENFKRFKNWIEKKTDTTGVGFKVNNDKSMTSEINFMPARVLMQDFTGIPALVDLASMRNAFQKLGGNPLKINPKIPVDLTIDHSVQVDYSSSKDSFSKNILKEYERNKERYEFLKWAEGAFNNLRIVPPDTGICHQINLEYIAQLIYSKKEHDELLAYPDTVIGTDSHTTMINGLGVLGWGVGGIEAEAAMLGQPISMMLPEVIGVKIIGVLGKTITATDLVLTITEILRKKNVVGNFVEYFGEGLANLTLEDRATIANMSPEYGATCGFFPIDDETIGYLSLTGRSKTSIELVKAYAKAQCLWNNYEEKVMYTDIVEIDLSIIECSIAGPKRPQDRIALSKAAEKFKTEIQTLANSESDTAKAYPVKDQDYTLNHGKIVIAAITSCTNTSNPYVMVAAGLLAKAAYEKNLQSKPWVKTSLAPGSQVVTEYLHLGKLNKYLNYLGFNLVGFGCTTCIGNAGPLKPEISESINNNKLIVSAILSGNRNFEGRIHSLVHANYLASPPLVVAYAIAGDININITKSALGQDSKGKDVYLKDIWPTAKDIRQYIKEYIKPEIFKSRYKNLFIGDENWKNIKTSKNVTYEWNPKSSYINNPPFFNNIEKQDQHIMNIIGAKILAIFGDSITTDHISPAGNILTNSPAGQYLIDLGIKTEDFNTYGARRGNHEVMMRGTLSNMLIKNEICGGKKGGITVNQLTDKIASIYDVSMEYIKNNISSVIFAGKEYGTGSSRDWAAKGIKLLGVKAVIAESFERIHRSNLVGMGILPLTFKNGMSRLDLNLNGSEEINIYGLEKDLTVFKELTCTIGFIGNIIKSFTVTLEVITDLELEYIRYGSIMHKVLKSLIVVN